MNNEIEKEYINFLNDTGKENIMTSWEEFCNEYANWFVEMFGLFDDRTISILNELNSFDYDKIAKITQPKNDLVYLFKITGGGVENE